MSGVLRSSQRYAWEQGGLADRLAVVVYKNELAVGTTSVTVSAGATVTANIADNHVDDVSVLPFPSSPMYL